MFGYIRPCKPELKLGEFEQYKAVYCGLCRELGRSFGWAARLTLSYDFTFLAMLHGGLSGERPSISPCRCCVNPLKKVKMCAPAPSLSFGADVAALMIYYKHLDNIQDSAGPKKWLWHLLTPPIRRAWRKAALAQPQADELLAEAHTRQQQVEQSQSSSPDEAAEPSAKAMAGIFALLAPEQNEEGSRRILERMGYFLGRYVYLCDALDDWPQDKKTGGYNPYVLTYGGGTATEQERLRQGARDSLFLTVAEIAKAYDLLNPAYYGPIIDNTVHLGLRAGVEELLHKQQGDTKTPKEADHD